MRCYDNEPIETPFLVGVHVKKYKILHLKIQLGKVI